MIVLWRVTTHCNLACGFCAYDRRLPIARQEIDVSHVARFGQILGDYRRLKNERVLLSWLGGEPLLWRPVFEISKTLRDAHRIDISATTNGSTLHLPHVVAGIVDSFSELTISIDGLAAFHDQSRGSAGAWQRMHAALGALVRARDENRSRLKLRANIVLMRDNLSQFAELCLELADWQIDEITFNQLGGRDRPEFFPLHSLQPQDVQILRALLPALHHTLSQRGVRLCASDTYLDRIEASAELRPLTIADCAPGERFLFIDEAGRISPCSFTSEEYGVPLDNIRHVDDLFSLPSQYRAARATRRAAACDNCPSNHVFAKFAA
jgi:MoaA/NifB/PqqE/SkfB family radical SAM enzyme